MVKNYINFNNFEYIYPNNFKKTFLKSINNNNYQIYNKIIKKKLIKILGKIINYNYKYINFNFNSTETNKKIIKIITKNNRNINIIYSNIEHNSIYKKIKNIKKINISNTIIKNNIKYKILYNNIKKKIKKNTIMVIINIINNEDGTIFNIKPIINICHKNNILLHIDGTQMPGKLPITLNKLKISSITLPSNKIYGPKNISIFINKNNKNINNKLSINKILNLIKSYKINNKTFKKNFIHIKHLHNIFIKNILNNKNIKKVNNINNKIPNIINIFFKNTLNIITKKIIKGINISVTSNCRKKYINSLTIINKNNFNNQIRIIINKYNKKIEIIELIKKIILI